ncbi:unnamed protein product, partial [Owenia fusiformis]
MFDNKYLADKVDPLVFSPLFNIREVYVWGNGNDENLYRNRFVSRTWIDTLKGLENSSIESIDFRNMDMSPVTVTKRDFWYLRNSPIKRLVLRNLAIVETDIEFFEYIPKVQSMDLSRNTIQMTLDFRKIFLLFFKLVHLKEFIFSQNSRQMEETGSSEILSKDTAETTIFSLPNLVRFELGDSVITKKPYFLSYGVKFHRDNALKYILISHVKLLQRLGPVIGLVHLEVVNFRDNDCTWFPSTFSCANDAFESIEYLDISHNQFEI